MLLLETFVNHGICPNVIRRGSRFLLIEIPEFHVRFMMSNSYVSGNPYELGDQFGLPFKRKFFPCSLLAKENFQYNGKMPAIDYFFSWCDSLQLRKDIVAFYQDNCCQNWDFKISLIQHENQKLKLLSKSLLVFLQQSFTLQSILQTKCNSPKNFYVNPFNRPLCSLSSFVFSMYKVFYLNNYLVYAVGYEYGKNERRMSKLEYEYCSFMNYKYPEKEFRYAFSHPDGQKYFKESIPDLYSPVTNELFYFNGCYYHAHYENCLINKDVNESTVHPFGKTYKAINKDFFNKINSLMLNNSQVSKVTIEWECNFKEKKQSCQEIKFFFDNHFLPHCLQRLKPRDAVRGAFSDVYALKWSQITHPDETFFCADVNGLYSFCAINFRYMIGKYKILIGNSLQDLAIVNNIFLYQDYHVTGAVLIKILPPKLLFAPFLMYRRKNGGVVNTLCKICAETFATKCNHSDDDRSFIGTYMISEIEFALGLGYKIVQIYEAHVYLDSSFILKDFIQVLNFFKTKYSDCFENISSFENQQAYCKHLNKKMQMDTDATFSFTPDVITPNAAQRNYYKLLCNSLFGKFIQRSDQTDLKFVRSQDELNATFFSCNEIQDFACPNENLCMLFIKKNVLKLPPNRKINAYIGSQITAYARQVIYTHLQNVILTPGCKVYQIECDSIYFSAPRNVVVPLTFSHAVGDFKIEYSSKILNFYSLGPKHYCINFLDKNNEMQNVCKFSGLSLQNEINQTLINHETFENFLNNFIARTELHLNLQQKIVKADLKSMQVSEIFQKFTVRNNVSKKRFLPLTTDPTLTTMPYGFTCS